MKNVEDIYPLSPMQEVMLLHALSRPRNDVLFNQFCYEIRGPVDIPAFQYAWQSISDRHPALRTGFVWKTLKKPLQVVRQEITVPFKYVNLRGRPDHEQQPTLDDFYRSNRDQGFDISRAPLNRINLFQRSDDRCIFVWSSHHLILDRWCLATIFDEFFKLYGSRNAALERPCAYRDYIEWVSRQDRAAAAAYWGNSLREFKTPTRLTEFEALTATPASGEAGSHGRIELSAETSGALRALARRHHLSLSILFQGAWALLLNHYTGRQDVVFGVTASGRPPELNGVESIVGSFVNNVPVRVRLSGDATLKECLLGCQSSQQTRSSFEYTSLPTIRECSEISADRRLFDTLLVWLSADVGEQNGGINFHGLHANIRTGYPLTLNVFETRAAIAVSAHCHPRYRPVVAVGAMLIRFNGILASMLAAGLDVRLRDLPDFNGTESFSAPPATAQPTSAAPRMDDGATPQPIGGREENVAALLQDLVLAEWRYVLGVACIDPKADFFDLGGDSLQAASLHIRIEAATRQEIPLLALFEAPTVSEMARLIRQKNWPLKTDVVIAIRAHGTKAPLFCVASPEVNTVGYALLARNLDPERPVYVVQAPPDGDQIRLLRMSELPAMASMYREAVQQIQPQGPYHLIGMCSGANLAVEMARQLATDGQYVGFLGAINTWAYYTVSRLFYVRKMWRRMCWYGRRIHDLVGMPAREQVATIRGIGARRLRSTKEAFNQVVQRDKIAAEPAPVRPAVAWAKDATVRAKYPGTVTVFRIARHNQSFWRIRDPGLGWGNEADKVEVVLLAGDDHKTLLMEPNVGDLGNNIQRALEQSHDIAPPTAAGMA